MVMQSISNKNVQQRQYDLDILRFIAAVSVMLFHMFDVKFGPNQYQIQLPSFMHEIASFGYLGVQLFFLISGYVIFFSAENKNYFPIC